jgi:hypothetical protein
MNQQIAVADTRANLELARAFADSKMVPEHFKKSVGDCYIAINLANRFGMDPWTLMQELYIVSGKPMPSGKLATAILNNSLAEKLRPTYSGEGDERTITLTGRPEGDAEPLSVTLRVKDAKTQNEQWRKNADQMLMYSAARMWGRRFAPDILLGIVFDDEMEPDAPRMPQGPKTQFAPEQIGTARHIPGVKDNLHQRDIIDELTGEVMSDPVSLTINDGEAYYDWGVRFVAAFRMSPDIDTVDRWLAANSETLAECQKHAPKVHGNLLKAVQQFKLDIMNQGEGT